MSISKIKVFIKWLFGGTEAVVDYVLGVLNTFLVQDNVASNVAQGYKIASTVLGYLKKYASWCPAKWQAEYNDTLEAVNACVEAFSDNKVTSEEVSLVTTAFKKAYTAWMEED